MTSSSNMPKGYKGNSEAKFTNSTTTPAYVVEDREAVVDSKGNLIRFLKKDERPRSGEIVKRVLAAEKINQGEHAHGDGVLFDSNGDNVVNSEDKFFKAVDHVSFELRRSPRSNAVEVSGPNGVFWFQDAFDAVTGKNQTGFMSRDEFVSLMLGNSHANTRIYDPETLEVLDI